MITKQKHLQYRGVSGSSQTQENARQSCQTQQTSIFLGLSTMFLAFLIFEPFSKILLKHSKNKNDKSHLNSVRIKKLKI